MGLYTILSPPGTASYHKGPILTDREPKVQWHPAKGISEEKATLLNYKYSRRTDKCCSVAKKKDALKFKLAALTVCVGAAVLNFGAALHPTAPAVGAGLCVAGAIACVGILGKASNQKNYFNKRKNDFFQRIYASLHSASSGQETEAEIPTKPSTSNKPTQRRNDGLNR